MGLSRRSRLDGKMKPNHQSQTFTQSRFSSAESGAANIRQLLRAEMGKLTPASSYAMLHRIFISGCQCVDITFDRQLQHFASTLNSTVRYMSKVNLYSVTVIIDVCYHREVNIPLIPRSPSRTYRAPKNRNLAHGNHDPCRHVTRMNAGNSGTFVSANRSPL